MRPRRRWAGTRTSRSSCPTRCASTSTRPSAAPRPRPSGQARSRVARRRRRPRRRSGTPPGTGRRCRGWPRRCSSIDWEARTSSPRASAGQKAMAAFAPFVPTMVGGAADLAESTKTEFPGGEDERFTHDKAGRNVFFGVREHGMGGAVNGMAAPRRDRAALRLDVPAVRRLHARLDPPVGAHGPRGRLGLHARLRRPRRGRPDPPARRAPRGAARDPGPDGPPPGRRERDRLGVARDPRGVDGPCVLVLSRQDLPILDRRQRRGRRAAAPTCCATSRTASPTWRSSAPAPRCDGDRGGRAARRRGRAARVVSMPLVGALRRAGRRVPRRGAAARDPVGVGRGRRSRWAGSAGWTGRSSIDRFGASAPGPEVMEKLGITAEAMAGAVRELLALTA